jgi:hypothetical protein
MRRYFFLALLALAVPAGITLETVVLFWTYPLSSLVALLLGVAFAAVARSHSNPVIVFCSVPTAAWLVWLLLFPLSHRGYGPALSQFIALNLAVFLITLAAVRWKQRTGVTAS